MTPLTIAGTGHRPDKLGGYNPRAFAIVEGIIEDHLRDLLGRGNDLTIISGMALGFDTALAQVARRHKLKLIAAVPFIGQELKWSKEYQTIYYELLAHASEVKHTSSGPYSANKMHIRNHWMVNNCDQILTIYNGSPGGTQSCLDYAAKKGKPVTNLWTRYQNFLSNIS